MFKLLKSFCAFYLMVSVRKFRIEIYRETNLLILWDGIPSKEKLVGGDKDKE